MGMDGIVVVVVVMKVDAIEAPRTSSITRLMGGSLPLAQSKIIKGFTRPAWPTPLMEQSELRLVWG